MEAATAAPPKPARRAPDAARLARVVFVLLCVGFAIGFLVFPTYPVYDSYYSLVWGQELVHGQMPTFDGFRYPTEHPLAIAVGVVLSLFGQVGDRIWVALILATFLALVAGLYRLGRLAATPLVGAVAAALLLTRFDYPFLAARGYIDIPYMALVVWAATLEAAKPRRGTLVLVMLTGAGLLRPEGWVMAALYWCWLFPKASWGQRAWYAVLAAAGPLIWAGTDFVVTGDPLFSLHYTSSSAEDLGRQKTFSELPSALPLFFTNLVKLPVLIASGLGLFAAAVLSPKRMAGPFALLATGLFTFLLIGAAGASVIERYLAIAALALLVFAGVALGGFTMLRRSWVRTAWMVAAILLVLGGVGYTATRLNLARFDNELRFRGLAHDDLEAVLATPAVQRGLRCGPLTAPNHKIVPDARWILGPELGAEGRVLARADSRLTPPTRGVAIVVTSRFAIFKHAWTQDTDSPLVELPPAGWPRVATSRFYAAYARC